MISWFFKKSTNSYSKCSCLEREIYVSKTCSVWIAKNISKSMALHWEVK